MLAEILRRLLYRERPVFRTLLPALLDALHAQPPFNYSLLGSHACFSQVRSRELIALIEADPRPRPHAVEHLLAACHKQLTAAE